MSATAGKRNVLFVGLELGVFEKISQSLSVSEFAVDYISGAMSAVELISLLPYDAFVAGYPLPDMELRRFLDAIRRPSSTSRQAAVVLLAPAELRREAEAFLGRGVGRVLSLTDPPEFLQQILPGLLDVAVRIPLRAVSRLEGDAGRGRNLVLCQTVNVSSTGMLIRTDQGYPLGAELAFELSLPGERKPIRGRAEVVRYTVEQKERISGVGVRFRAFEGEDRYRFESHLQELSS